MLKRILAIIGLLILTPPVPDIVEVRDDSMAVWSIADGTLTAQEATLSAPVSRTSEAKYKVRKLYIDTVGAPNTAVIEVSVQDSANTEIRYFNVGLPGSTPCTGNVGGLITAMMTTRATETGGDGRKMQFRVLGYLSDQVCLSGVTLVP
jgi:hypothetical protein